MIQTKPNNKRALLCRFVEFFLIFAIFIQPLTSIAGLESFKFKQNVENRFLPAEEAFSLLLEFDNSQIKFTWQMPEGYYLYKHSIKVKAENAKLSELILPEGIKEYDDYLGDYQIYKNQVVATAKILSSSQQKLEGTVYYQGCAASGYCYQPMSQNFSFILTDSINKADLTENKAEKVDAEYDKITSFLIEKNMLLSLLLFLLFGVLLSFTPCVLPMIPIVSGIIVEQGVFVTKRLAFTLSSTYVLAMATTYGIAGAVAGYAGASIQASLQSPIVISLMAFLFVLLALSLFGFYELRLPHKIANHFHGIRLEHRQGSHLGALLLGVISALVVSPCVSAPLVGALAYIGQTGNFIFGGLALFCLGIGIGLPLILAATLGAELLPKRGSWMHRVKAFFGVLLLALALIMLARILSAQAVLFLWGIFLICLQNYLTNKNISQASGIEKFYHGIKITMLVVGICFVIGAASGNSNPLAPLANFKAQTTSSSALAEQTKITISSVKEYEDVIRQNKTSNKPILLDFYANWCLNCQIMERTVINSHEVQQILKDMLVIVADVSENDGNSKGLLKKFNVYAPPTYIFLQPDGLENKALRLVGEVSKEKFVSNLRKLIKAP